MPKKYWRNWSRQVRRQFQEAMPKYGLSVTNTGRDVITTETLSSGTGREKSVQEAMKRLKDSDLPVKQKMTIQIALKAMAEDYEYQKTMEKLGMEPEFPHQSTKRQQKKQIKI